VIKFTVYYHSAIGTSNEELELIKKFLQWQGIVGWFESDGQTALKLSKGRGFLAIVTDDDRILYGFKDLVDYFDENGLWRM
jgi:hypothetical protein